MNNYMIDEKLFYREVNSLLKVNHKNVVRFLGLCANTE
uniref:Serine-threonine/tyrosine-protein kinase catalytic domain-containing protein n=1 Tax=Triticum urartu TaxID=4572 RepID=A0A8R7Q8B4_TRIUA